MTTSNSSSVAKCHKNGIYTYDTKRMKSCTAKKSRYDTTIYRIATKMNTSWTNCHTNTYNTYFACILNASKPTKHY
jgi:hypothetical protein